MSKTAVPGTEDPSEKENSEKGALGIGLMRGSAGKNGHQRIRWQFQGPQDGPLLILFVGIHGNEPAGVRAIDAIQQELEALQEHFRGSFYVVTGNLRALEAGVRYIDTDLNRLWEQPGFLNAGDDASDDASDAAGDNASETVRDTADPPAPGTQNGSEPRVGAHPSSTRPSEYDERLEIRKTIHELLHVHEPAAKNIVFADLHTTSSESCAFILINDTLANRRLARKFPLPQILGIEENIHGTLLSYLNNEGYISVGFEAGAHNAEASVSRTKAFLKLLLHNTGVLLMEDVERCRQEKELEVYDSVPADYYEIKHHKHVEDPTRFRMEPGFENFDPVERGQFLATEDGIRVYAPMRGRIFMPLYQSKGHDGFLIIRKVPLFWVGLSAYLRGDVTHRLLQWLPGVKKAGKTSLTVNLNIARYFVKDIFHLLGYRVTQKDEETLVCYRR